MNNDFKKIPVESVLFFDIETVRRSKTLDVDSEEFVLFQKKTRNRDDDTLKDPQEVIDEYQRKGALYMGYNRIVSIGVGFVNEGKAYIKHISGEESDIIKEFCTIASGFRYVCGFNIINFDLPILINIGWKYFDMTELLPDPFITSGKKPWNMGNIVDLMELFKGTHYLTPSFDEVCFHFGVPTPKSVIDGSQVSETFYNDDKGINIINQYVKGDVFALINVFFRMRNMPTLTTFEDRSGTSGDKPVQNLLQKLYTFNSLTDEIKEEIAGLMKGKTISDEEKDMVIEILQRVYVRTDFVNGDMDNKDTKEAKMQEVEDFINSLVGKKTKVIEF